MLTPWPTLSPRRVLQRYPLKVPPEEMQEAVEALLARCGGSSVYVAHMGEELHRIASWRDLPGSKDPARPAVWSLYEAALPRIINGQVPEDVMRDVLGMVAAARESLPLEDLRR